MPKRYRIDMTITNLETNTQVGPTRDHEEKYKDDDQAQERFGDKVQAARDTGKGSEQE